MKIFELWLTWVFALIISSMASAAIVERTFLVQNKTVTRLCHEQVIVTVNGLYPGPKLEVTEGDSVIVHVVNNSPYNVTIHWHGVFQLFSAWADGPEYITQCSIRPGYNFTYKFNVTEQEGTIWWHAHASAVRATVHGALIIRPRSGQFPFPKPYKEVPIILGDWYDGNVEDLIKKELETGDKIASNAFTINGFPGDLFNCSKHHIYKLRVKQGKTYLFRMVNAALNNNLFFKITNHKFTVVASDAAYTEPYVTDILVIAAGQSADVLFTADQPKSSYYMAASPYVVGEPVPLFDNTTTRGILYYEGYKKSKTNHKLVMPALPLHNNTPIAHKFFSSIKGLVGAPHWVPVPLEVDEHMFITINMGLQHCPLNATCTGPLGQKFSASMNNESFALPVGKGYSIQEAYFYNVSGIYTTDFPDNPPKTFNFVDPKIFFDANVTFVPKSTKVRKFKFNSTVEVVFQNTAILNAQSHPMHLHGMNFHILAQDFGIFNPATDRLKYNLVNPQIRNTVPVPVAGWAAIRFRANNPGVWFLHCHVDDHNLWGLVTAFIVENGPTPPTSLGPPPADLPKC
ncbi:laccase-7-like [Trifolium pratense]|uniref:laccase-7-like n=1 Tax=Trifolium pratense TaxID=57577 RepID=UPI001E694A3F|nr:laccase-7-like [Trifolium pratense]